MDNKTFLKKISLKAVVYILLLSLSFFIVITIVHEVLYENEDQIDIEVSNYISQHLVSNGLTSFMKIMAIFASSEFLLPAYIVLVGLYLLYKKDKIIAVGIALIGIVGYVITYALKNWFQRARPSNQLGRTLHNFSFPSGHSVSAFIFYGLLIIIVWKENISKVYKYFLSTVLISFALLIDLSRVYLRVHYASDVVAGFCIGFMWLTISIWILNKITESSRQ